MRESRMKGLISAPARSRTRNIAMSAATRRLAFSLFFLGPFGIFASTFAVVDYNRKLPAGKLEGFKEANRPESLRQCLKNLHSNRVSPFTLIDAYESKCAETYVVHKLVTERVKELKGLDSYKSDVDYRIQMAAADELEEFTRKMCRRAMIRNSFYMDWLIATICDNGLKCCAAPVWVTLMAVSICV
jgi:hypothetical protein